MRNSTLGINQSSTDSDFTQNIVARLNALPALPDTALAMIELSESIFASIDEIADAVQRDPAIAARLIAVANSAYFSPARPLNNVRDALAQSLGTDLARGIVWAMAMQSQFVLSQNSEFDSQRFWHNTMLTAEFCRVLAVENGLNSQATTMYTSGLLSRVGLWALASLAPDKTNEALREHNPSLREALISVGSIDHHEMTRLLIRHWHIPIVGIPADIDIETAIGSQPSTTLIRIAMELSDSLQQSESELASALQLAQKYGYGRAAKKAVRIVEAKRDRLKSCVA